MSLIFESFKLIDSISLLFSEKSGGSLLNAIRQRKQRTFDVQKIGDEEDLEEVRFKIFEYAYFLCFHVYYIEIFFSTILRFLMQLNRHI